MRSDERLLGLVYATYALGIPIEESVISLVKIGRGIEGTGFDPAEAWEATHAALLGELEPLRRFVDVGLVIANGDTESERALSRLRTVADAFGALV